MCETFHTNRSAKNVYIDFFDEEEDVRGARKLPVGDYDWAKKFKNPDFLVRVAKPTEERDIEDAMFAEEFKEDWITYAT